MLVVKKLSKSFGTKILFEEGEFVIHKGEKVALIGQNGTGKSTLIKCIAQQEDFEGIIDLDNTVKLSIMEQEKDFEKLDQTFSEYLEEKENTIEKLKQEYEEKLKDPKVYEDLEKLEKLLKSYEALSRRVTEKIEITEIKKILEQLNFEMDSYNKKIINLSGGQKTKLRLAECFSKESNFILLDEPTNHLDFQALEWLENELTNTDKTILIVSHDRYLLKKVVNKEIEIENKKFQVYKKDYESYRKEREKHLESIGHQFHTLTKEKKRLLDSAKEKREWMQKSGNKLKAKRIMVERLERRATELPKVPNPKEFIKRFKLNFGECTRSGNIVFTLKNIEKSFGDLHLFKKITLDITKGERIAIIGENGSGKSTLLKMLAGLFNPDQGTLINGHNINIGYFDQEFKDIDLNQNLIDFFWKNFPSLNEHNLISLAIKFGFPKDKLKDKLKTLSGGEKARLNFVRLMLEKHNVLLLDEPTNNLDVELTEVLEEALKDYKGTIIFVSHDRYFIDKLASTIFIIENRKITEYKGNYSSVFN